MPLDEQDQYVRQRLHKLQLLREEGIDPYPARVKRSHTLAEVREQYSPDGPPLRVDVAGRLTAIRNQGKMAFADIKDDTGRLQLLARIDELGSEQFGLIDLLDLGDFVGASGEVFTTKRGELTVRISSLSVLAKSLRVPPEKWHGITDVEKRYRQRYLDLMSNPETVRVFRARSAVIHHLRRRLVEKQFLEVETPVLQPIPGGGAARPFRTYYNALDRELFLRIALELYLKRCTIGGMDRIFEIGRNFRNEGLSTKHNPEFTMLECYQAYADYGTMMELVEGAVTYVAQAVLGTYQITFRGAELNLAPPWRRVTMSEALLETTGKDFAD
jgi:lysyl-tRNA synthetase class 2